MQVRLADDVLRLSLARTRKPFPLIVYAEVDPLFGGASAFYYSGNRKLFYNWLYNKFS